MRHLKSGTKISRTSSHFKSLMKNLAIALIERETINTTLVKAKELRRFIEPLITRAKTDTVFNRRFVFSKLNNDAAVGKLFKDVATKSQDRKGGYLRIIKSGYRKGDNALLAYVELVDK